MSLFICREAQTARFTFVSVPTLDVPILADQIAVPIRLNSERSMVSEQRGR